MYRQNPSVSKDSHNLKPPKAPERPLTAYMRFSRKMWPKIRQENPDNAIWDVSKTIKKLWRELPDSEKLLYRHEFEMERIEYEKILKSYYNSAAYQQYSVARTRVKPPYEKPSGGSSRKGGNAAADLNNVIGIIVQPVDEEDPLEMTAKRLSSIRYDRNNRLMAELFAPNYLPDSRTVIPQQRVDQLEKQRLALAKHQQKLNDDLCEIEEAFNHRKQSIEASSTTFDAELKRLVDDRPEPTEERYDSLVSEWETELLKSYDDYKKQQAAIRARLEAERREAPVLYSLTCGKSPSPEVSKSEQSHVNGTVPADSSKISEATTDDVVASSIINTLKENGNMTLPTTTPATAESTTMEVDENRPTTTTSVNDEDNDS